MKRYVVLLAGDPEVWNTASQEQQEEWMADHGRFDSYVVEHGALQGGEALDGASTATTVRHRNGAPVITDGPFVELVEQLGGFYVVDLPSLDHALAAAKLLPSCYAVEIRPIIEM